MNAKRKEFYRKKGVIVVWTCAYQTGLPFLLYLKQGDGKHSLFGENYFGSDRKLGEWEIDSKEKLSLLITAISNRLRMQTVKMKKIYIQPIKEIEEDRAISGRIALPQKLL